MSSKLADANIYDELSKDKCGEAWCRSVANLLSGLETMPSNDRVFESSLDQHLRRAWHSGNAIQYEVVVRNAFTDPYLRIAVEGGTEYMG